MFFLLAFSAFSLYLLITFLVLPLIDYFRDPKGFRKFNNYSVFSGISDWPYCFLSQRGFRSRDLTELHKKSSIIRIGPNNLSFGHLDAIRDIYGHGTPCIKDLKYVITGAEHPNLFDVVEKKAHTEKRKRLAAAFAIKHLEDWEYKVARTTERLLVAFDKLCTSKLPEGLTTPDPQDLNINFNMWINLFTIEAINYLALSSELGLLEQGDDVVTAEKMDGTLYQARYRKSQNTNAYAISQIVWDYENFHMLKKLSNILPSWRKLWKEAAPFGDVIWHQANNRLKRYMAGEKLDDFFTALMDDKQGQPYNSEWGEIVGEIGAIIDAGADTTAIALSGVMELLIQHPQHLATLRQEVDNAFEEDEMVASYDKVKSLPFLRACLDEAMRFMPPTSAGLPRRTPPEGARILGHWIPGNTSVSMPIYTAHHDESVFHNAEEFNPHRWMDPNERRRMESFFIPFSTGGRGCIGRNISYLEQTVVLASLVRRYEFALPSPTFELKRFEALNLICGDQPMKFWRREIPA